MIESIMLVHNGDHKNGCPFWNVRLWTDGQIRGDVVGPRTKFKFMEDIKTEVPLEHMNSVYDLPRAFVGVEKIIQVTTDDVFVLFRGLEASDSASFTLSELHECRYKKILELVVEEIVKNFTEDCPKKKILRTLKIWKIYSKKFLRFAFKNFILFPAIDHTDNDTSSQK